MISNFWQKTIFIQGEKFSDQWMYGINQQIEKVHHSGWLHNTLPMLQEMCFHVSMYGLSPMLNRG